FALGQDVGKEYESVALERFLLRRRQDCCYCHVRLLSDSYHPAAAVRSAGPEPPWSWPVRGSTRIAQTRPKAKPARVELRGSTSWPIADSRSRTDGGMRSSTSVVPPWQWTRGASTPAWMPMPKSTAWTSGCTTAVRIR